MPGRPHGSSPGTEGGRARSCPPCPPPRHRLTIAKATWEPSLAPPPLRTLARACTTGRAVSGFGEGVMPPPSQPDPPFPGGSFPLHGAEPAVLAPIGCWWPGWWPSTCHPRLSAVLELPPPQPDTTTPPRCPFAPKSQQPGAMECRRPPNWMKNKIPRGATSDIAMLGGGA